MRKGVSPVVATLLLILIAVAAAVLLYTWVSGLSANVAGSKVTGKSLTLIQATWAMAFNDTSGDKHPSENEFFSNYTILLLSFKAPPAVVGKGGSSITFDNADVLYSGRVICHYDSWALSDDDKFHVGQRIGGMTAIGFYFMGYAGNRANQYDLNDTLIPGGIIIGASESPYQNGAAGQATSQDEVGYVVMPTAPFVTLVAGVWGVNYVSTKYVETNFKPTNAEVRFSRFAQNSIYISLSDGSNYNLPLFDLVQVSQDDFTVVIWCNNINMNVMNSVDVRLQFQDGSTWSTNVPLSVQ